MGDGGFSGPIPLCRCKVLYLGSAVPLDTSVGLEAVQAPLRERYSNIGLDDKIPGIDSILSVFSSGMLMQYCSDDSYQTWFPIDTLHVCAAVKAVMTQEGIRFVSVDSPQALISKHPPIFACIMRRTKGVKVLECHMFICKSNEVALALVQSCTHAYKHKEGWGSGDMSTSGSSSRLIPAQKLNGSSGPAMGRFYDDRQDLVQQYKVSAGQVGAAPPAAPAAPAPQPAPQPPPQPQYITMNPPGAPVPPPMMMAPPMMQMSAGMTMPPPMMPMNAGMTMPQGPMFYPPEYFNDWDNTYGQAMMFMPNSPFYPGDEFMNEMRKRQNKKKGKKKKHHHKKQHPDSSDEEVEEFYVRRPRNPRNNVQNDNQDLVMYVPRAVQDDYYGQYDDYGPPVDRQQVSYYHDGPAGGYYVDDGFGPPGPGYQDGGYGPPGPGYQDGGYGPGYATDYNAATNGMANLRVGPSQVVDDSSGIYARRLPPPDDGYRHVDPPAGTNYNARGYVMY